jgi:hypothetical protein
MPRLLASAVVAAVFGLALAPASSSASILINAPSSVACGSAIKTGVWDRPDGQTTSRRVKIQIRSARGYLVWSRTVRATSSWRYFRYRGSCGRSYKVSYSNPQFGTSSYRVRVGG